MRVTAMQHDGRDESVNSPGTLTRERRESDLLVRQRTHHRPLIDGVALDRLLYDGHDRLAPESLETFLGHLRQCIERPTVGRQGAVRVDEELHTKDRRESVLRNTTVLDLHTDCLEPVHLGLVRQTTKALRLA